MVDKERLVELAERCEAATGPSYTLDCEIWDAIYPGEREERWQEWLRVSPSSMTHNLGPADRDGYIRPRRAFTASLDAAMQLVPEGFMWRVRWCELPNGTWVSIARIGENGCGLNTTAVTPSLSLCAAALRASGGQHD